MSAVHDRDDRDDDAEDEDPAWASRRRDPPDPEITLQSHRYTGSDDTDWLTIYEHGSSDGRFIHSTVFVDFDEVA